MALPADSSPAHQPDPAPQAGQDRPGSHAVTSGDAAPGDQPAVQDDQPADRGTADRTADREPGGGDSSGDADTAPRLPGLPRLFFPDDPAQPGQAPGRPYGEPRHIPGLPPGVPGQAPSQPAGVRQGGGRERPARQRPTRPPERELRQRAVAALVFGALSLVALLGLGSDLHRGVYLLIFSAVVGVAACVIGITAVRKARRTGVYRPRGAVGGIVLGALAALLAIPILATYLAFPAQVNNYVKCLDLAQSSSDQRACEVRFFRSLHLSLGTSQAVVRAGPAWRAGAYGSTDGPVGRGG
jgi:hypothetical protein